MLMGVSNKVWTLFRFSLRLAVRSQSFELGSGWLLGINYLSVPFFPHHLRLPIICYNRDFLSSHLLVSLCSSKTTLLPVISFCLVISLQWAADPKGSVPLSSRRALLCSPKRATHVQDIWRLLTQTGIIFSFGWEQMWPPSQAGAIRSLITNLVQGMCRAWDWVMQHDPTSAYGFCLDLGQNGSWPCFSFPKERMKRFP